MKFSLLILILILLHCIWSFHYPAVDAISEPPLSDISAPLFDPPTGLPSSMAAFYPGIQQGSEENRINAHKRTCIALVVASAALGLTILLLLSLWIHKKYFQRFHKSNAQSSCIIFLPIPILFLDLDVWVLMVVPSIIMLLFCL